MVGRPRDPGGTLSATVPPRKNLLQIEFYHARQLLAAIGEHLIADNTPTSVPRSHNEIVALPPTAIVNAYEPQ